MFIDKEGTAQAPGAWEIWRTTAQWQAMRKDARSGDIGKWGPLRKSRTEAVRDANRLNKGAAEHAKGDG